MPASMLNILWYLFMFSILQTIVGCDETYDNQLSKLQSSVSKNKIGSSQDVWLEKHNLLAPQWDKVSLIFGYVDDYSGCEDIAEQLSTKYPLAKYRCVPAN